MSAIESAKTELSLETSEIKQLTVSPCPCWSIKHTSFFSCFSLILLIKKVILILFSIVGLIFAWSLGSFFTLLISSLMLVWLLFVFIQYVRKQEYGTPWAFYFAIALLINYSLLALFFFLFAVSLPFLNLMEFKELEGVNSISLYVVVYGVFLPLLAYGEYLVVLYFMVISTERDSIIKQSQKNEEVPTTQKILDESI